MKKQEHKFYAVKMLRNNDVELLRAIKNEFLIQKALDHPNIVKVHEMYFNPITSRVYIVMELVEGVELFEAIDKQGAFDGTLARYWQRKRHGSYSRRY
jgi:serine/threonine protein kinase